MAGFRETFHADMAVCGCTKRGILFGIYYFLTRTDYSAVLFFRLSQMFYRWGNKPGRILSLFFWRLNTLMNACDLRPQANVGPGLNLPHPVGVVIGFPVTIGRNAHIHQHVTFGRKNSDHIDTPVELITPVIVGDNVLFGAGAVILSGADIGDNCEVGANSVVIKPVPANSIAFGVPARVFPKKAAEPDTVVPQPAPLMNPVSVVVDNTSEKATASAN